jgi:UDP-N-acetylglucosamine:LPS N-acetylglucosamine transferase
MILMDSYGGHERINAAFFKKIGAAMINENPMDIGTQAAWLLSDSQRAVKRRLKMSLAQRNFTRLQNLAGISDFTFSEAAYGAGLSIHKP